MSAVPAGVLGQVGQVALKSLSLLGWVGWLLGVPPLPRAEGSDTQRQVLEA